MTPERDHIDDMGHALFEAARRERPSDAVRRRAMERAVLAAASRRRSTVLWFSLAAAAVVAGLALVAFAALKGSPSTIAISEERSPRREVPPPALVTSSQPAPPSDEPRDVSAAMRRPSAASKHDAGAPRARSLSEEIKALDDARAAVETGNPAQALRLLGAYEKTAGPRRLASEATLLRIRALAALGRHSEAAALARRFIQANPADPLVDRARAFADIDSGHTQF